MCKNSKDVFLNVFVMNSFIKMDMLSLNNYYLQSKTWFPIRFSFPRSFTKYEWKLRVCKVGGGPMHKVRYLPSILYTI